MNLDIVDLRGAKVMKGVHSDPHPLRRWVSLPLYPRYKDCQADGTTGAESFAYTGFFPHSIASATHDCTSPPTSPLKPRASGTSPKDLPSLACPQYTHQAELLVCQSDADHYSRMADKAFFAPESGMDHSNPSPQSSHHRLSMAHE